MIPTRGKRSSKILEPAVTVRTTMTTIPTGRPVGLRGCGGIRSVIVSEAEYAEACRALESRVSNRPGPRLSGWRATSLVDPVEEGPIATNEVAKIRALEAEVAQLKEMLATLKSRDGEAVVAQPKDELATAVVPSRVASLVLNRPHSRILTKAIHDGACI